MPFNLQSSEVKVPLSEGNQVAIHRMGDPDGIGVICFHDLFQSSQVFRNEDKTGIADILINQGYQVFLVDHLGHGESWPAIRPGFKQSFQRRVTEELPAIMDTIHSMVDVPLVSLCQGWAGVEWLGFLARHPKWANKLGAQVFLGTRRVWQAGRTHEPRVINLLWKSLMPKLAAWYGYAPGKGLGFGEEKESREYFNEVTKMSEHPSWVDGSDQFDYGAAVKKLNLPPSLYLASFGDEALGHSDDVREFMKSLGVHDGRLIKLGKKAGNLKNYDRNGMINHKKAHKDHLPVITQWMASVLNKNKLKLTG